MNIYIFIYINKNLYVRDFHFVQIQLGNFLSSSFKLKSLSINYTKLEEDLQPTLDHLTSFFHKNQLFEIVPLQKISPKDFIFFPFSICDSTMPKNLQAKNSLSSTIEKDSRFP
jgi:hypothetical protein